MIHLTTERLILRDWRKQDLDAWAAINADPEVRRHLGDGGPCERKDAWHMMAAAAGNQALCGFGMWAAEERATGVLIGRIGLYEPPHFPISR
jgi:RimJ/RimL family protein N-acetyltransferase